MPEKDAFDITRDEVQSAARRNWNRLVDHGRRFLAAKLLVILVGALGFVAAAKFFLPGLVAAGCAVVFLLLGGWAIQTQRLLNQERERRYWTVIEALRVNQSEVQAQVAVREATLVIADLPGGRIAQLRAYPPLVQATHYARRSAQATAANSSPRQGQRADALPKPPDLGPVQAELTDLREREKVIEAEIQALAAPGTKWEDDAVAAKGEYQRAKRATFAARQRVRSGKRPTDASAGATFEVGLNRDGTRPVNPRKPTPTPEQIFRGEEEVDS